jgi:hypothetical protein
LIAITQEAKLKRKKKRKKKKEEKAKERKKRKKMNLKNDLVKEECNPLRKKDYHYLKKKKHQPYANYYQMKLTFPHLWNNWTKKARNEISLSFSSHDKDVANPLLKL